MRGGTEGEKRGRAGGEREGEREKNEGEYRRGREIEERGKMQTPTPVLPRLPLTI